MASTSSSHQQNAFSGIEPPNKRRKVEQSSRVFDVFINHRGPDVKLTLATQLYNSLKELGIRAFLDSEEKELGDSFPSTIETAITSASVHIAIFSEKYAESPWCLAELLLMLQSKAKIIPLFYQVEPSDLRYIEKGKYAEAFLKYEEKKRYLEKLQEWKEALQQVSYTTGYEFKNSDFGDCKDIVSAVEKEVQRTKRLHVAKYPVGLHKLIKDFERQCLDKLVQDFESKCGMKRAAKEKGNIVGIFGMGGVGKTTLSKELFNQKRSKYTRASFLFDVREASTRAELPNLQSQLLEDLFCEDRRFRSAEEGTSCLRDRLERCSSLSFLIVLDDIDHVEQLDALLVRDIINKCGNNLVIITTRNVGVLVSAGIDIGYALKGLDREDGRELFCWHAFDQPLPLAGYEDLVQDYVNVCGGLPLSIIVLGRHLSRREQWYWQDELEKVKEALPGDIKRRLKISIDTLDNVEKQIFMDIACFFIGKSITKAMLIWKGSGWRARRALETLKEKCLVEEVKEVHLNMLEYKWESSIEGFSLRMHDHLRDLGREMADELSHPRRVWRPQDLNSLELKGFQNILTQTKSRCFHSIVDKSIGCGITYFLGEPKDGSNASLLWLQLEYLSCPPLDLNSDINSSIFSWIPLENLQCLRISNGCFQKLWQSDVQAPYHLEELQIRDTFLEEFPDLLGKLNNMKKIVLNAKDIQTDIWYLLESLRMNLSSLRIVGSDLEGHLAYNDTAEGTALKSLVIYGFKRLWEEEVALNNEGWSRTVISDLENLEINGYGLVTKILINGNCCQRLQSLKLCDMKNLIEADLARIKTLNSLEISGCLELVELRLADLSRLEKITIENCSHLKTVSGISNLAKLVELEISGCEMLDFECLCLSGMKCLERITVDRYVKMNYFELDRCENLKTIMFDCKNIVNLSIRYCTELERLPDLMGPSCLKRIVIDGCGNLKYLRLNGLENLESLSGNLELTQLDIINCPALKELPSNFGEIKIESCEKLESIELPTTLSRFSVKGCKDLQGIAGNTDLTKLEQVYIAECPKLDLACLSRLSCLDEIKIESCEKLQSIELPTTLSRLSVKGCKDLQGIAGITDLTKLEQVYIAECPKLDLACLSRLSCLDEIKIESCEKLQSIELPTTLIRLSVKGCKDLQGIAGITDLTKLEQVYIAECPKLDLACLSRLSCLDEIGIESSEKLQSIELPTTLSRLFVEGCRNLHSVVTITDLTELKWMLIKQCPALEELPSFARVVNLGEIKIESCEKLQNITLPTTLIRLSVEGCRALQRIVAITDLTELKWMLIKQCPALEELPSFARVGNFEEIEIESCEKLQSIELPTTLSRLSVEGCRNLDSVVTITDLTELKWMLIKQCPALEELPSFARVVNFREIRIESCKKLQNITLPTTLIRLSVKGCRALHSVVTITDLTELKWMLIKQCPALEELPSLARVVNLGVIKIESCDKLQNITLPTTLIRLSVEGCRALQRIVAITDLTELKWMLIKQCPALEELPSFARVGNFEEIEIESCEKLQSIELPTTLSRLFVEGCRNLHSVVTITDLTELKWMLIKQCPALEELPSFARVVNLGEIKIESCEKLQNITLPTTLIRLSIEGCRALQRIVAITDLTELKWMLIKQCPALEELPSFARVGNFKEIEIKSCEKLQSIELPTTLSRLSVEGCRNLDSVVTITDLTELKWMLIKQCPALEELPSFARVGNFKEIKIESCEKLQSIELPTTLSRLSVEGCRNLHSVVTITDLTKLKWMLIKQCPALEELPSFARVVNFREIKIESCEKLESIELPTTLSRLSVKGCKDLQRIAGITDLTKLEQVYIAEYPKLDLACLSGLSCTKRIVIESCENLQNISAIEEWHVPENATLTYCSCAVVRNFIDKWKSMPKYTCVIGRAVDGAESSLNDHLFSEANIGVDGVIQIGADELCSFGSEWGAVIVYLVDRSTLPYDFEGIFSHFKMRQGESLVTFVRYGPPAYWLDEIENFSIILRFYGRILKKGFRVDLKKGEEWKSRVVLRTIVDRLYDHK